MKKMFAVLIAVSFGLASIGSFAMSHGGAAPVKDKDGKVLDCKDKDKDSKECKAAAEAAAKAMKK